MRNKKEIAYAQDIKDEVERIKLEFSDFMEGVRVLFLIHRNKEGGDTNNTKVRKIITQNSKEFIEELSALVKMKNESEEAYRIYSSVNDRNVEKAIRKFKYEQLDADYYDGEQKHQFYFDIRNRWIGCLMQPQQKKSSLFLFDVDTEDNGEALKALHDVEIVKSYKTKNGWHIVTQPFNHTKKTLPENVELKIDGLLLLSY